MPVNQVKLHIHFVARTLPNVEEYANEVKIQSFPWRSLFFHYVPLLYAVWNELDRKNQKEENLSQYLRLYNGSTYGNCCWICGIDHNVDRNQVTEILNIYYRKQKD